MAKYDVDGNLVRKLARLLEETGLGELEFETESWRVRVARPGAGSVVATAAPPATAAAPGPAVAAAAAAADAEPAPDSAHPGAVTSPMVGTIYLSPAPGEPVFVRAGQDVVAGETLMLVEAMKTFNEIKAPKAGTLARLLVENGQPVEYGEVLAVIE